MNYIYTDIINNSSMSNNPIYVQGIPLFYDKNYSEYK